MRRSLERSVNRLRLYCRCNFLLAHLAGKHERGTRWPAWAEPHDPAKTRALSKINKPGTVLGEAGILLATTASIYLLIAILIGILTRSP